VAFLGLTACTYKAINKGGNVNVAIRSAVPADAEACGRIIYEAFKSIADRHGFLPHFPTIERAIQRANHCINHPSIYAVVAESEGQVIGSNFLDERDPIRGLGPVTVGPAVQVHGIGRRLMEAVLERARGALGVRLVQDSFNMLSISLYASLGFEVKEPLLLLRGKPNGKLPSGIIVRPVEKEDLSECAALCKNVHGFDRLNELSDGLEALSPVVGVRDRRITAYALDLRVWPRNHAVAETQEDMKALLLSAGAMSSEPLSFLLPVTQARFFRWCLSEGFRAVMPMTLMAMGKYQKPDGCYIPSILY
jgi:predicted N-acetyltransferase YhbS